MHHLEGRGQADQVEIETSHKRARARIRQGQEPIGFQPSQDELIDGIERIVDFYMDKKEEGERFLDTYRRLGTPAFKEALYADA